MDTCIKIGIKLFPIQFLSVMSCADGPHGSKANVSTVWSGHVESVSMAGEVTRLVRSTDCSCRGLGI